jgi:hypothetical protein
MQLSVLTRRRNLFRIAAATFLLALPAGLLVVPGGAAAKTAGIAGTSLGIGSPSFAGPAAAGCASGCDLLTGPFAAASTASFAVGSASAKTAARAAVANARAARTAAAHLSAARLATLRRITGLSTAALKAGRLSAGRSVKGLAALSAGTAGLGGPHALPNPEVAKTGPDPAPPSVSCLPLGPGCDRISLSAAGAVGVKGINAVDSGTLPTNPNGDIEPADQGLCAGNGYVVESNNIGEVLFFNTALHRVSSVISLDTLMGLTARGWSSGGDVSCAYDYANGGHWFFTQFVSASSEASGGTFAGCFAGVASTCYEAIAVTKGSSPYGPYNVYFVNANYNPAEPGAPYLLNDFTKIAVSRDAFLMMYDEFPLVTPGIGGGGFNGAQEFAFDKNALEFGLQASLADGTPNPRFNVAIENMGTLPTPDGTCAKDNTLGKPGVACWFSVIPAMPPDPSQFDNSHGGSAFMLDTLDPYGTGDTRIAVFDWTGLGALNSPGCAACDDVQFGGQLFSGTELYYGEGVLAAQKAGPIPLGDQCGAAGLSTGTPPPASCPEGGIATNGDNFTQASQAQGQLWGAISTEVAQNFAGGPSPEIHQGAAYWVIGTGAFDHGDSQHGASDHGGPLTITSQGYVAPAHEDLSMPDLVAPDAGPAALFFTLTGNGGPAGADGGGFYPSTAYGKLFAGSPTLLASKVNVADLGQSPEDGFGEYLGYPGPLDPRWGDYSEGVYDPATGKIYFANNYIQYPNCTGAAFTAALATCGGTRDYYANWGTSVNAVSP